MEQQKEEARGELGRLRRGADRGDLVQAPRAARRDRVPRLRAPKPPRPRSWRWSRRGEAVQRAAAGEEVAIVVNQTPFYAESGGQVGDTGTIARREGRPHRRSATCRSAPTASSCTTARSRRATLAVGDAVRLSIDRARRATIRANHSATHLLHAALRNVLGRHVAQKGSLVAPDRLRFDFSHPKPIDAARDRGGRGRSPTRSSSRTRRSRRASWTATRR